ncbi:alpha/beta hydrolase [Curvibacter sp. PAE-UM]|uniref:alpha/beta hydrolase n=1 Tax=Curvibacter sp. PAE-UM TaxID=1714344 RepID=UPI000710809B|nr:alpha/beta fold hydrolase [Curvibacter sp. PAE-UM]KRH99537.1 lysophospholipase [Curvibacter sp. PAE-UM]
MSTSPQTASASYYGNSALVRLARLGLSLSQQLWPGLAVRAAQRLFGTPLPPRWLRRPRAWPTHWLIERWPFERAGLTLYRDSMAAGDAPAVLLVHGWGGHAGQMLPLATALAREGLQPVILEMPAHGRSAGGTSNLPQFARAVEYAAARLQARGLALHAVVAHSLGANAAAHAASRSLAVQRLVLLAPPASPHDYTHLFARMFGLSERTRGAMQQRIEAREGILMPQFEPPAVGPRIRQPVLVVHDRGDRINRYADGEAYARAIAGAQLQATEGLGHMKILKDPAVLADVADFVSLKPR